MPHYKVQPLRTVDPLIEQGHRVFLSYSNPRAFETRMVEHKYGKYGEQSYKSKRSRMPTRDLLSWMEETAGPRGVLWQTEKTSDGINVYFAVPGHAMLAKLTWGGV